MHTRFRSIGFMIVGAVAGVLISLNFQVFADRAMRTSLPIEELRASPRCRAIKTNYVGAVEDNKRSPRPQRQLTDGPALVHLDDEASASCRSAPRASRGPGKRSAWNTARQVSRRGGHAGSQAGSSRDLIIKLDTRREGHGGNDAGRRVAAAQHLDHDHQYAQADRAGDRTITRAVSRASVKSNMIEPGRFCALAIPGSDPTPRAAPDGLFRRQVWGLVLDLRNYPCGLLHGALGLFAFPAAEIPGGVTDGRAEDSRKSLRQPRGLRTRRGDVLSPCRRCQDVRWGWGNGGSASASEIVDGAAGPQRAR